MQYAKIIKSFREQKGLFQKDVALACDITPEYLSKIENGAKLPSMVLLQKLANVFEVPLSAINFLALNDDKIPAHKKENYEEVKPIMDKMINYLFVEDTFDFSTLKKDLQDLKAKKDNRIKKKAS